MRKTLTGVLLALGVVVGGATPAFAYDCFNPTKTVGAGSKGLVTLDASRGETFTPAGHGNGNGNGNGGFITIDATALVPGAVLDIHVFGGQNGPKDGVVGPGAEKAGVKGCDGKGIDYVESCFGPDE